MRKLICGALALILAASVGAPAAFACGGHRARNHAYVTTAAEKNCGTCHVFLDEDGDGVCDSCDNVCPNCGQSAAQDQQGKCQNCGTCTHFTDADADTLCDDCGGCGEYRDSDCNGVCDHHAKKNSAGCSSVVSGSGSRHNGRNRHHN